MTDHLSITANMTNGDVRQILAKLYEQWQISGDSMEEPLTVELFGASFVVSEDTIFGAPNVEYIDREIAWYNSMSPSVDDIPGGPPQIWQRVAAKQHTDNVEPGDVNSNYGLLFWGGENYEQFTNLVETLKRDKGSRQAVAIYTRPQMHYQWDEGDMSDFICTNVVHYQIRGDRLNIIVQMRSNDAVYGFRNDIAWQGHAATQVFEALKETYPDLQQGNIVWQAASLHVYPRHFHLLDTFLETGEYLGSTVKPEYRDPAEVLESIDEAAEAVAGITLDDEGAVLRGDDLEPEGDIEIPGVLDPEGHVIDPFDISDEGDDIRREEDSRG